VVRVAAVWARDGRNGRIAHHQTADATREQDALNRKGGYVAVDVAGYMATGSDGKPIDRYAALRVEKAGDDDARLYVGLTADLETELQSKLKDETRIPRTGHAMAGSEGRTTYCGVWGRPPEAPTPSPPASASH
jgi:hypothetical protein